MGNTCHMVANGCCCIAWWSKTKLLLTVVVKDWHFIELIGVWIFAVRDGVHGYGNSWGRHEVSLNSWIHFILLFFFFSIFLLCALCFLLSAFYFCLHPDVLLQLQCCSSCHDRKSILTRPCKRNGVGCRWPNLQIRDGFKKHTMWKGTVTAISTTCIIFFGQKSHLQNETGRSSMIYVLIIRLAFCWSSAVFLAVFLFLFFFTVSSSRSTAETSPEEQPRNGSLKYMMDEGCLGFISIIAPVIISLLSHYPHCLQHSLSSNSLASLYRFDGIPPL